MKYFVMLMLLTGSVSANEYLRSGEKTRPHRASEAFKLKSDGSSGTVDRSGEYNQPAYVTKKPDPWAIKQDDRKYRVEGASKSPCYSIRCK